MKTAGDSHTTRRRSQGEACVPIRHHKSAVPDSARTTQRASSDTPRASPRPVQDRAAFTRQNTPLQLKRRAKRKEAAGILPTERQGLLPKASSCSKPTPPRVPPQDWRTARGNLDCQLVHPTKTTTPRSATGRERLPRGDTCPPDGPRRTLFFARALRSSGNVPEIQRGFQVRPVLSHGRRSLPSRRRRRRPVQLLPQIAKIIAPESAQRREEQARSMAGTRMPSSPAARRCPVLREPRSNGDPPSRRLSRPLPRAVASRTMSVPLRAQSKAPWQSVP